MSQRDFDIGYSIWRAYRTGFLAALNRATADPTFMRGPYARHSREAEISAQEYADAETPPPVSVARMVRLCEMAAAECEADARNNRGWVCDTDPVQPEEFEAIARIVSTPSSPT